MSGLLSAWREWRDRRDILRDLRRQQGDASERDQFKVKDDLTYALSALERDDPAQATQLWTQSLSRYPRETRNSPLALKVLLGLRRFDEAQALMQEGRTKNPREVYFARSLAEVAQARGNHDEVIRLCADLRKQYPGVMEGYGLAAGTFAAKGQLDEAEALAAETIKRFPDQLMGYLEYGRIADRRMDWPQALARWQVVQRQFGHHIGYTGTAQAMLRLERYHEADTLLSEARALFPTNLGIFTEFARSAQMKGDVMEAKERWNAVLKRFPQQPHGFFAAAEAFEALGEPAEAEATLRVAIDRFPREQRPFFELAHLLQRRGNVLAAAEVWAGLRQAFPDTEESYIHGAEALAHTGRSDEAEALRAEHRRRFGSG
ncbi:tetratricopeptide repeat protein [Rhodopila sp.]|uniref:tetratricopeptide repeat protein n=1 Tax=Rhodopila sp. TaxID=2480087 RepID=UPI003D0A9A58